MVNKRQKLDPLEAFYLNRNISLQVDRKENFFYSERRIEKGGQELEFHIQGLRITASIAKDQNVKSTTRSFSAYWNGSLLRSR